MPELLFPWKPSPPTSGRRSWAAPTAPPPPLLQPAGVPTLKMIPLLQISPAGAGLLRPGRGWERGGSWFLPLVLRPRCGDTKTQAREKMGPLGVAHGFQGQLYLGTSPLLCNDWLGDQSSGQGPRDRTFPPQEIPEYPVPLWPCASLESGAPQAAGPPELLRDRCKL